jgi:hypothetical protein
MPAKKRTTRKQAASAPAPPVETSNASPESKEERSPSVASKPAAKRPRARSTMAEPQEVVEVGVATPIVAEAPVPESRPAISADDIRRVAFFLSQRRRGASDPFADWVEAERMLSSRTT